MNHRVLTALSLASLGWFAVQSCSADEPGDWQYEFTPYMMTAGLNGDVGVRGVTTEVDASFGDILDNLDAGFMGQFMAEKGPWMVGLEVVYMNLETESSGAVTGPGGTVSVGGRLDVDTSMYIYQGTLAYRVLDAATRVDVLGAVRFTELDAAMSIATEFTPGIAFPGGANSVSGSESWTDFVVGARVLRPLTDTLTLVGYADLGAGGSDFTYQLLAGVNWGFGENLSAKLGYRYLAWDYADDGTVWDMSASGPYLGLGIRF